MSNGDMDTRNAPPNPAVKITVHFEQGNTLIWLLEKPWDQADLFMEIGLMGAKYEVGIEFDFTVGDEGEETAQLLKDLKGWPLSSSLESKQF